jgi:hypothetical protein
MSLVVESGITIGTGVSIMSDSLLLNLDAATYTSATTVVSQNTSGTSGDTGFFFRPNNPTYAQIVPGWTVVGHPDWIVTAASCNPADQYSTTVTISGGTFDSGSSYSFTNANVWFDTVANKPFYLYNDPVYSAVTGGGAFEFDPASGQYANAPTSLIDLPRWSVIVWHYYTNTNSGGSPCIISEVYPGSTGKINYVLGSAVNAGLQAAYYAPGWVASDPTYNLVPETWNQIAGTYDGNNLDLYVNNTQVATVTNTNLAGSSQGGINLMQRWDLGDYWGGYLSIVKIYAASIGAGGVADDWAANAARFGL